MNPVPDVMLNNGRTVPQLGFGVFQVEPGDTVEAVTTALQVGYRHIDTAEMYGNEKEVGEAVAKSGLAREDVFVTSKLSNDAHLPDDARAAFDLSLEELGLRLARSVPHALAAAHPLRRRLRFDLEDDGGVLPRGRLADRRVELPAAPPRRLHADAEMPPAVNQIEVHPYLAQDDVRAFCAEHQIAVEAWSPLGQGRARRPDDHRIAAKDGKTPPRSSCAGTSSAATSSSPSRSRPPGSRRTSTSSASSCPARMSGRSAR